ncbi:DUF4440 domain-containing protein [Pseudomonas sp. CDFA 553]|uniref:nuclear transport factor 2 family protein n=1 Tax=Pseudomonas quasicaspiana TaxID=2829821 RepID=UPI001E637B3A|nr:DUF4440 domain-containing protein [Pseudomonas quasicaspiana]MCD5986522.1 DUF4440 domain-containing protein [Pseudomonas quasicaspiana]
MNIHAHIEDLEHRLLQQDVRADEATVLALIADDFMEFSASGRVWTKDDVITGLKSEAFVSRSMSDVQVRALAADVVLITYVCQSTVNSLRSSIWRKHRDIWQMTFHQGTKIE